jgi:hypothetical protein
MRISQVIPAKPICILSLVDDRPTAILRVLWARKMILALLLPPSMNDAKVAVMECR